MARGGVWTYSPVFTKDTASLPHLHGRGAARACVFQHRSGRGSGLY